MITEIVYWTQGFRISFKSFFFYEIVYVSNFLTLGKIFQEATLTYFSN